MAKEATLSWTVGNETVYRILFSEDGKLLLSSHFLQGLLPLTSKFVTLHGIIQYGEFKTEVEIPSHKDVDGNLHFLIDYSLTLEYRIIHCQDSMYVTDSEEEIYHKQTGESSKSKDVHFDNIIDLENTPVDIEEGSKDEPYSVEIDISETETQGMKSNIPIDLGSEDDSDFTKVKSIVPWLLANTGGNRIKKLLADSDGPLQVLEIPKVYDGNLVFELPPTFGKCSSMDGMQQKYDGHMWSRPRKSNMSVPCNVKLSYCLGSLQCQRYSCVYFKSNKRFNDRFFNGFLESRVSKGLPAKEQRAQITCQYCKQVVSCVETCLCSVYYIIPEDINMSRLMIHQGEHNHPVEPGTSRAAIERLRKLVGTFLNYNRGSGPRKIQMLVARQLLMDSLTTDQTESMGEIELNNFLEELIPLVQNQRLVIKYCCL